MRKVIYTRQDGGLSVVSIAPSENTDEQALKKAWDGLPADAIDPQIVAASDIPADRTFRNAWCVVAGKVEHDLVKCKIICHEKRRASRSKELSPLDIEATIPMMAAAAEINRQAIRDKYAGIQTQIDTATDVATLKTIVEQLCGEANINGSHYRAAIQARTR